jgi:hypothetical protein
MAPEDDLRYGPGYRFNRVIWLFKHFTMREVTQILTAKAPDGTCQIHNFDSPGWKRFLSNRRRFIRRCKKRGKDWRRQVDKYYAENEEADFFDFLREQYQRTRRHGPQLTPAMRARARESRARTKKLYGHHRGEYR